VEAGGSGMQGHPWLYRKLGQPGLHEKKKTKTKPKTKKYLSTDSVCVCVCVRERERERERERDTTNKQYPEQPSLPRQEGKQRLPGAGVMGILGLWTSSGMDSCESCTTLNY
jgi:hypothetical protein